MSEDELPAVQKPSVKDAENVSDDELPGPKPAELPADTEVFYRFFDNVFCKSYLISLNSFHEI